MRQRGARNEGFFNSAKAQEGASFDALYKGARQSGSLNLSQKNLDAVPAVVFCLDAHASDGEKFWEFNSLTKLDLSHNQIAVLPAEVSNLVDLTSLKARHNHLTRLPPELLGCPRLRHLDLADNQLTEPLFAEPSPSSGTPLRPSPLLELTECHLASNALSSLPQFLCYCSSLRLLNLSENHLTSLPAEIGLLKRLTHLSLKQNQLRALPASLGELDGLQELDVRRNLLQTLPEQLLSGRDKALQVLDVGENKISQLPQFASNLGLLRLHLEFNHLTAVPESLFSACQLTLFELHLHDNQLTAVPPTVGLLNELKVLDVSNNALSDLPPSLGYISTLQRLLVDGNPIRTIRRSLLTQSTVDLKKYLCTRGPPHRDGTAVGGNTRSNRNTDEYNEYGWSKQSGDSDEGEIPLAILQRLRNMEGAALDLSGLQLTSLPPEWPCELYRSHSLESTDTAITVGRIDFSNNCLQGIPKELFTSMFARSLQELVLVSNELGGRIFRDPHDRNPLLPPFIKRLNLAKNKLSSREVSDLLAGPAAFSLLHVLLPYNLMDAIPPSLSTHTELRELQLSFNKLTNLESLDFKRLPLLTILDVSNNQITQLGNVHQARALQTLLLENNDLRHIPLELGLLEELQTLGLFGNPQKTIRQALIHKGTDAILLSLRGKLDSEHPHPPPVASSAAASLHSSRGSSSDSTSQQQQQHPSQSSLAPFSHQHQHQRGQTAARATAPDSLGECRDSDRGGQQGPHFQPLAHSHRDSDGDGDSTSTSASSTATTASGSSSVFDLQRLEGQVRALEQQLEHPSLSQAKRFALKKDMAKARANMIRLKRGQGLPN